MYFAYVSKHNLNREKQVILVIISNGEGWHYLATTKLSALSRRRTSKQHHDFYCLHCIHYFAREKECENH